MSHEHGKPSCFPFANLIFIFLGELRNGGKA